MNYHITNLTFFSMNWVPFGGNGCDNFNWKVHFMGIILLTAKENLAQKKHQT